MRIGLAQINTIVGDLAGNRTRILEAYQTLVAAGAELVLFPELVVCGYPPRDLLFKSRFVADVEQTTREIAAEIGAVPAVIGYTEANLTGQGRAAFNAAAVCQHSRILASARKSLHYHLAAATQAGRQQDTDTLARACHTIKGTLLQCGINGWAERAQDLYNGARSGHPLPFELLLGELQQALAPFLEDEGGAAQS